MMWNFLVSGLAAGCTLVLYDGSPLRDPAYLWRLVDYLGITLFGTSAKYIDQLSVRLSLYLAHRRALYRVAEIIQASRTSLPGHPAPHLFNGLASRPCALRLCVRAHPPARALGVYHR